MTTGEKIKKVRLDRGFTQKDLCGEFITRNMLSKIENGSALPSLATLDYIAKKLDIDAGYFISETDDPTPFIKLRIIDKVRKLYFDKDFSGCLELSKKCETPDIELALYFASSSLLEGKKMYEAGDFTAACSLFEKAKEYLSYIPVECALSEAIDYEINKCRRVKQHKFTENVTLPENGFAQKAHEALIYDFLLRLIRIGKHELAAQVFDQMKISNPLLKKHIHARLSMASSNHARARTLLSEIVESFDEGLSDAPFRYSIYSDLEYSCKTIGDYEGAYKSAAQKNRLAAILGIN